MRKTMLIFYSLFAVIVIHAQSMQVRLQESGGVKLNVPKFLSSTGSQYQLIDIVQGSGAVLIKVDSGFSRVESRLNLPTQAYNGFLGGTNDTALAVWQEELNDSIVIQLLESTVGAGNEKIERWSINKMKHPRVDYMINDVNNRFFFLYTVYNDTVGSIVFNGVLLDRISKKLQSVVWSLEFDQDQQRLKAPIVDGYGNIHAVIYDKLTNHKLSASIQLYTRSITDQSTIIETFSFDKIKLYDLDFSDNPIAAEVQLRGFYYAGDNKGKVGLVSIGFPYKRTNKLSQKFTPVPEWQKLFLVEGLGAYNKRFEPLDYLKATGFVHHSGSTAIGGWVLDMPYKNFVKDREQENLINTLPSGWIALKKENLGPQKGTKPSLRNDQLKQQQSNNMLSESGQFRFGLANVNTRNNAVLPPTINDTRSRLSSDMPYQVIVSPFIKIGKIAFFVINENGVYDWIQVVSSDFPIKAIQRTSQLFGNSIIYGNMVYTIVPVTVGETKRLKLFQMGKSGINELVLDETIPVDAVYGIPQKIKEGHFISLYKDVVNQKSGILHLRIK
jgi:hypothetical protein